MSRTEWVYDYDADGNRTGLRQVVIDEDDTIPSSWGWFTDIEDQVILRERQHQVRHDLTPREFEIAKMERAVLAQKLKNGFCPAIYETTKEHWYQTETGQWKREVEAAVVHNIPYVYSQIQQRLASFHVNHMTFVDIRETLEMVSAAYQAAEARDLSKPVITIDTRKRLRRSA